MRPSRPVPNFRSTEDGLNSKVWTVQEELASRTVFDDSHTRCALDAIRQWPRLGRRHCAVRPRGNILFNANYTGAELHAKRRSNKMHNLVVSCLVVAYLSANVYAIREDASV